MPVSKSAKLKKKRKKTQKTSNLLFEKTYSATWFTWFASLYTFSSVLKSQLCFDDIRQITKHRSLKAQQIRFLKRNSLVFCLFELFVEVSSLKNKKNSFGSSKFWSFVLDTFDVLKFLIFHFLDKHIQTFSIRDQSLKRSSLPIHSSFPIDPVALISPFSLQPHQTAIPIPRLQVLEPWLPVQFFQIQQTLHLRKKWSIQFEAFHIIQFELTAQWQELLWRE